MWALCLASALVILKNGMDLIRGFRGQPGPEQLDAQNNVLASRVQSMERAIEEGRRESDAKRQVIYAKIETVAKEMVTGFRRSGEDIAGLKTNVNLINAQLSNIDGKLDRMNERPHGC